MNDDILKELDELAESIRERTEIELKKKYARRFMHINQLAKDKKLTSGWGILDEDDIFLPMKINCGESKVPCGECKYRGWDGEHIYCREERLLVITPGTVCGMGKRRERRERR